MPQDKALFKYADYLELYIEEKRSIRWKLSDLNEWLENQQGEFL